MSCRINNLLALWELFRGFRNMKIQKHKKQTLWYRREALAFSKSSKWTFLIWLAFFHSWKRTVTKITEAKSWLSWNCNLSKKSNLAKHRKIGLARHWLPINREGCCTVLVKYQPLARDASELPPTYTQFAIHDWLYLASTVLGPPKRGFTWLQI